MKETQRFCKRDRGRGTNHQPPRRAKMLWYIRPISDSRKCHAAPDTRWQHPLEILIFDQGTIGVVHRGRTKRHGNTSRWALSWLATLALGEPALHRRCHVYCAFGSALLTGKNGVAKFAFTYSTPTVLRCIRMMFCRFETSSKT